jgi:hypothetical protein
MAPTLQVEVPLQFRVAHASEAQVMDVPTQVPSPLQLSPKVQALASSHADPAATGSCLIPVTGSHESTVQGFPSSTGTGAPGWHDPAPSHIPRLWHGSPSEHDVPAAAGTCETPKRGSQLSTVQGFPSSTGAGGFWHE